MGYLQRRTKTVAGSNAKGSIAERHAAGEAITLAEVLAEAEVLVVIDISGSMSERVGGGYISYYDDDDSSGAQPSPSPSDPDAHKSKHQKAQEQLDDVQAKYPGAVAVVAFDCTPELVFSGVLPPPRGSTAMDEALKFARPADGILQVLLISDGEPNSQKDTLDVVKTFMHPIHTMYIGRAGDSGEKFMNEIAQMTGGSHEINEGLSKHLIGTIRGLLHG